MSRRFVLALMAGFVCSAAAVAQTIGIQKRELDLNNDGIVSASERKLYLDQLSRDVPKAVLSNDRLPVKSDTLTGDIPPAVTNDVNKRTIPRQQTRSPGQARREIEFQMPDNASANIKRNYEIRLKEMSALDANGNGILEAGELWGGVNRTFDAADSDRDGALSQEEIQKSLSQTEKSTSAYGDNLAKQRTRRIENRYKNADQDDDGTVSKQEYQDYFSKRQINFDRNGDGKISPEEYRTDGERLPSYYNFKSKNK